MKRQSYRLNRKNDFEAGKEMGGRYKAKKRFGQHFLKDENIARQIVNSLEIDDATDFVVEIGPGQGVLSKYLIERFSERFHAIEIDRDLFQLLLKRYPSLSGRLHLEDFLQADLKKLFPGKIALIGNFPYNISTQIIFRIMDYHEQVQMMVGMFQKEVAMRIVANEGSKDYGIISVLLPVRYKREYLFELPPDAFSPPPKVHSAVIRLRRNELVSPGFDEVLFKQIVKAAFNQRRKMLRNSLSEFFEPETLNEKIFEKRPEQLSKEDFILLTKRKFISSNRL